MGGWGYGRVAGSKRAGIMICMLHVPSRLMTSKWGAIKRFRRASWTVWIVALLPEP